MPESPFNECFLNITSPADPAEVLDLHILGDGDWTSPWPMINMMMYLFNMVIFHSEPLHYQRVYQFISPKCMKMLNPQTKQT